MDELALRFRPLAAEDLRLVHEWLQRPHVQRWWSDRKTYEEVVEHYLPSIEGREPTDHYIVLLDEQQRELTPLVHDARRLPVLDAVAAARSVGLSTFAELELVSATPRRALR